MRFLAKAGFLAFVLAAIGAGAWAYYELRQGKRPDRESSSVFPSGAAMYLETADLPALSLKIRSRSMAMDGLRVIGVINGLCGSLQIIDSITNQSEIVREQVSQNPVQLAFYPGSQPGWLLAFNVSRLSYVGKLKTELAGILRGKFSGDVMSFRHGGPGAGLRLVIEDGIVLVSNRQELIERALNYDQPRLANEPGFIRFRELHPARQLLTIFTDHSLYRSGGYEKSAIDLSLISNSGFSGMEVETATSEIRMNGFVRPDSSDLMTLIGSQAPYGTADFLRSVPVDCKAFRAFAIDSLPVLYGRQRGDSAVSRYWRMVNDTSMYNLQAAFTSNGRGVLGIIETGEGPVISLTVRDTSAAREHLQYMSDSVMAGPTKIYRIATPVKLFAPLTEQRLQFVFQHGDILFFGNSYLSMVQVSGSVAAGELLAADRNFMRYAREHISEDFNYLAYCAPSREPGLIGRLLGIETDAVAEAFSNFSHFSFSVVKESLLRARMHLLYSIEKEQRSGLTLWSTQLDTTCTRPPSLFKNHATGGQELAVVDDAHNLYLITAKGEVLWKRKIGSAVISEIHIVDAFRNNKLQMLFNTSDAIHLVDRNGNYVEGYPLKLKTQATAPMSVFDYENTRDYRLLIPCKGGMICNFSIDGKEPATFSKPKTDAVVNLPVKYANIGGSEYLVAVDAEGKIYTFSRRGQLKGTLQNKVVASCSSFYIDAGANPGSSHIVYPDEKNGLLNKISFTDKKEILKLGQDMPQAIARFDRADNNRFSDLVVCFENKVFAYDLASNLIYENAFDCRPTFARFYHLNSSSGLYIYCSAGKKLHVHDRTAGRIRSYVSDAPPLMADLFANREQYLIYPLGKSLRCVGLN